MNTEYARKLLYAGGVFYDDLGDPEDDDEPRQVLNMNDTFAWALAFGEPVSDEELSEVARLFQWYGFNGLNYWVSEKNNQMDSEFFDVSRGIQFVRHEEALRSKIESSSTRAYTNIKYTLGKSHILTFARRIKKRLYFKWLKIRRPFK